MATVTKGSFTLFAKLATVVFGDTTAVVIAELPARAFIVDIKVDVQTAFSGGTTQLDIGLRDGSGDTADHFANNIDVSGTGRASVTLTNGGEDLGDRPVQVIATVASGNSAGEANVLVEYICLTSSHLH